MTQTQDEEPVFLIEAHLPQCLRQHWGRCPAHLDHRPHPPRRVPVDDDDGDSREVSILALEHAPGVERHRDPLDHLPGWPDG